MVLPEYRAGRAVMYLFRAMSRYLEENQRGCRYHVSHLVTTHTRTQKILQKTAHPFVPLFLFSNMVPRPDFIGIDRTDGGRESLLWKMSLHRPLVLDRVCAPESKHDLIRRLLDSTGEGGVVAVEEAHREPTNAKTRFRVQCSQRLGFARIHLEEFGRDWFPALAGRILDLIGAGTESINVYIPAQAPQPPKMEQRLASLNLVFSGLNPAAPDRMDLAYCLTTRPENFNAVKFLDPVAVELLECMKKEHQAPGIVY